MMVERDRWFLRFAPRNDPAMLKGRLFCFHFAGGAASFFRTWGRSFAPDIDVVVMQLPGRETRQSEPFILDMESLLKELTPKVPVFFELPTIFFGHSMGALIAFELAHRLGRRGTAKPDHLVVSGKRALHLPAAAPTRHLSDSDFVQHLKHLKGTPDIVLDDPDMLEFFLPRLRADTLLLESYRPSEDMRLDVPILALGGIDDHWVGTEAIIAWKDLAAGPFDVKLLPGGHFFIRDFEKEIHGMIRQLFAMARAAPPDRALSPSPG